MKHTWADFKKYVEDLGVVDGDRINSINITEPDRTEQHFGKELHVERLPDGSIKIISL